MKLYNWQVFLTNYSINSLFPIFPEWCLRGTKLYWLSKTQNFEINLSDCKWDFSLIVEQYLILNPVIKANWMLKWQDVTLFWRCHLQMFSPIPSLPCSYCKSRVSDVGCTMKDVQIKIVYCLVPRWISPFHKERQEVHVDWACMILCLIPRPSPSFPSLAVLHASDRKLGEGRGMRLHDTTSACSLN